MCFGGDVIHPGIGNHGGLGKTSIELITRETDYCGLLKYSKLRKIHKPPKVLTMVSAALPTSLELKDKRYARCIPNESNEVNAMTRERGAKPVALHSLRQSSPQ